MGAFRAVVTHFERDFPKMRHKVLRAIQCVWSDGRRRALMDVRRGQRVGPGNGQRRVNGHRADFLISGITRMESDFGLTDLELLEKNTER